VTESASRLVLRPMTADDESEVMQAQRELAEDGFGFVFLEDGDSFGDLLERTERYAAGDVPDGKVPASFYVAEVDGALVGRVSIRHALNEWLLGFGGHVGYGVRPAHRRRGYASEMLRQSLEITDSLGIEHVLVTCDDHNIGSARTIEGAGGVLENVVPDGDSAPKRRYWIDRTIQTSSLAGRT
jgi:predicted acetyltransferase